MFDHFYQDYKLEWKAACSCVVKIKVTLLQYIQEPFYFYFNAMIFYYLKERCFNNWLHLLCFVFKVKLVVMILCFSVQGETGEFIGKIVKNDPVRDFHGYADQKATATKIVKDVFVKGDCAFLSGECLSFFFFNLFSVTACGQENFIFFPLLKL